jgi:4'-phosphopantetheinyl transferase
MEVHWLQQRGTDVPPLADWLSAAELLCLGGLRFEKRRADWRLGRWTAKATVATYLGIPRRCGSLREIEVRPEPLGAPVVWIGNERAPVTISLTHRDGVAVCAIAAPGVELGCDVEAAESRSAAFVADYFTPAERAFVEQAPGAERPQRIALLWSAKESALKALRIGLRMDTRDIAVSISRASGADPWSPLRVSCHGRNFHGWWRSAGQLVHTVVAAPTAGSPARLMKEDCP